MMKSKPHIKRMYGVWMVVVNGKHLSYTFSSSPARSYKFYLGLKKYE